MTFMCQKEIFSQLITYDSMAKKLDRDPSYKLIYKEKCIPISVGVGSNVGGFKDGVCYTSII